MHVCIVAAATLLILGLPFSQSESFANLVNPSDVDAVSSASTILDAPSGSYVVFINASLRPDEKSLQTWTDFFEGREISFIFEDISCMVASGDAPGLEMAKSYQSRLPENQMKLTSVDATLMLSKAEYGRFDFIVMSKEAADAYSALELAGHEGVVMLEVSEAS